MAVFRWFAENTIKPSDELQITTQFAIGDPVASVLSSNRLIEDNGWPNVEGRLAVGVGAIQPLAGGRKLRAIEVGISGLIGELRNLPVAASFAPRSTIKVWGFGLDLQIPISESCGLSGEFFTGQGLGEYSGGIGQKFNSANLNGIRSTGGWLEAYYYISEQLHWHAGYGVDSPLQKTLSAGQLSKNQTYFSNFVWDASKNYQLSFEVDYRKTAYLGLGETDGLLFITQFLWKF